MSNKILQELIKTYHQFKKNPNSQDWDKCYVCEKKLRKKEAQYIGKSLYRHHTCEAGSTNWKKHRKDSELYSFFKEEM
jgi:hypothetical protein